MAEPVLGPIFFISFVLVMMFALLNMFLSIISDTFAIVKDDVSKQSNDYEILDFLWGRFKGITGLNTVAAAQPADTKVEPEGERDESETFE